MHKLSDDAVRGIVKGHATGSDRSAWEDEFLGFVTLIEATNHWLRGALVQRRHSLSRGLSSRVTKQAQSPTAGFAIAQNVQKATKPVPAGKGTLH